MGVSTYIDEERGWKNDKERWRHVEHLTTMRMLEDQNQNQNGLSLSLAPSSTNLRRRKESGNLSGCWMDFNRERRAVLIPDP